MHKVKSTHGTVYFCPTIRNKTTAFNRSERLQYNILRFRDALQQREKLFLEIYLVARANSCNDTHHPPSRIWFASQERRKNEDERWLTRVMWETKWNAMLYRNMVTTSIKTQLNSYVKYTWLFWANRAWITGLKEILKGCTRHPAASKAGLTISKQYLMQGIPLLNHKHLFIQPSCINIICLLHKGVNEADRNKAVCPQLHTKSHAKLGNHSGCSKPHK